MIRPDIEPIGHVSPRKPVDLNPRAATVPDTLEEIQNRSTPSIVRQHEIWDAVVSTATGSNISGARPDVSEETHTLTAEQVHAIAGQVDGWTLEYLNTDSDKHGYMG